MVLGTSEALGSFLTFGRNGASTPSAALQLYEKSSAVAIPINMIVDAFKVLEPILLVGDIEVPDHPVIKLLRNPSPYFSMELFFEMLGKDFLITGENITIALGGINRPPLELQPLSPSVVTVPEGSGGLPTQFSVAGNTLTGSYLPKRERDNRVRYVMEDSDLRELKQIRNFSTKSNSLLRGQSLLVSASREVTQHILGGDHNVSLLEEGGRVSLVFNFASDMSEEDFKINQARINAQYGGPSNAGRIGVTSGENLEIKTIANSMVDMDFANLQKMAQKAVALTYHVPLPLVSDERQTLDNYGIGKVAIYDDAVIPLSRVIFGGLGELLLPRYGLDPTEARITFDPDQVTALVSRRNDELLKRAQLNVDTKNELRAFVGKESVGPQGDVLLVPSTLVPLGTDLFTDDNDPNFQESVDA